MSSTQQDATISAKTAKTSPATKKQKRHKTSNCLESESILKFDSFGAQTSFNYGGGSESYQSSLGACIYFGIMMFTLVFTVQQVLVLHERNRTLFTTTELKDYQEVGHSFGAEDGFRVAFALIDLTDPEGVPRDGLVNIEFK